MSCPGCGDKEHMCSPPCGDDKRAVIRAENCFTLPDGDCVGGPCMHNPDVKPGESIADRVLAVKPEDVRQAMMWMAREMDEHEHLEKLRRTRELPHIRRWQLENDKPDTHPDYGEMLTWLFDALDVARAREARTQAWLEKFQGAAADQAVQIMELRAFLARAKAQRDLAQRLVNQLPLCADHRDKMPKDACLACGIEGVTTYISAGWPQQKWVYAIGELRKRLLALLGRQDAPPA